MQARVAKRLAVSAVAVVSLTVAAFGVASPAAHASGGTTTGARATQANVVADGSTSGSQGTTVRDHRSNPYRPYCVDASTAPGGVVVTGSNWAPSPVPPPCR
jgi:hypothetical protein